MNFQKLGVEMLNFQQVTKKLWERIVRLCSGSCSDGWPNSVMPAKPNSTANAKYLKQI